MADENEKLENRVEENTAPTNQKKKYDLKGGFKGNSRQIILTSLMLAVTVIAALMTLSAGLSEIAASKSGMALFLGVIAFVSWIVITVLAVKNKDRTQSVILGVIFLCNLVGSIGMVLLSAGGDSGAGPALLSALIALPYFAAYPLLELFGLTGPSAVGVMALISIAFLAVNIWNYIRLLERKKKTDLERSGVGYMLGYFGGDSDNKKDRW